jgi:hypothetical protein
VIRRGDSGSKVELVHEVGRGFSPLDKHEKGDVLLAVARRHSLVFYFVLAYAITWAIWIPAVALQESVP